MRMFEENYSYSVIAKKLVAVWVGSVNGQGAGRLIWRNLCKVKVGGD